MDIPQISFGSLLRNWRMDLDLTQEKLAEKLDITPGYLGDLERHKSKPSLNLFCHIVRTLNASADDYVYPNQNANNDTYHQLLRLLAHCNDYQLNVLLSTATALLNPPEEPKEVE